MREQTFRVVDGGRRSKPFYLVDLVIDSELWGDPEEGLYWKIEGENWSSETSHFIEFTGLHDTDGVEVYEGDRIRWDEHWNRTRDEKQLAGIAPVGFVGGEFALEGNEAPDDLWDVLRHHNGRCVGNIYETPERLK